MLEYCRICGENTHGTSVKNLFDEEQKLFIHHIELLTGEWLEYNSKLPPYICVYCEQDLMVAASFRDRCIRTQNYYQQQLMSDKSDPLNVVADKTENDPIETKFTADDELIPSDEECEYEYDQQQQMDEMKIEYLLIDENNETVDCQNDLNNSDENEEHIEDAECEDISNEVDVDGVGDDEGDDDDDMMGSMDNEEDSHDEMNSKSMSQKPEQKRTSNAAKVAVSILNHIEKEKLKSTTRRKYINWKKLNDEERRELKRLQRKRDCVCDQCGRHFTDPSNLKLHLIRHSGIKKYECEECNTKFYTPHLLKRHSLMHKKAPTLFACQYCERTFIYNNFKLKHERSHFKERRFQCGYCDKLFFSKAQQKDHELVHTRIRKYKCELCDQQFLRRTHLRAHNRSKTHKNNEQRKNISNLASDVPH